MPRAKVLMTGPSLAYKNQGDNLLYFAVGEIVRSHYSNDVEISAFSAISDPQSIAEQAPWLKIINPRRHPFRALGTLIKTDVYLIAGAIPFHDNLRLMAQQFAYALISKLFGAKFIVNAVSVQPISKPLCKLLFRWTEHLADEFSVRDQSAAQNAAELGARQPVRRNVDPGIVFEPASDEVAERLWREEGLPESAILVGMGPHIFINKSKYFDDRYQFKNEYQEYTDAQLDAYYDAMGAVADALSRHGPVVFVSLSTQMPPGDDREACQWIVDRMKRPDRAHIVQGEYSTAELMGLLRRLDIYVSTRLHGYALAVGAGVPTIAVEFHPKMRGLAQELDIEDWVIPFDGISGESVLSVARSIVQNLDKARSRLRENLQRAREKAISQITDALP